MRACVDAQMLCVSSNRIQCYNCSMSFNLVIHSVVTSNVRLPIPYHSDPIEIRSATKAESGSALPHTTPNPIITPACFTPTATPPRATDTPVFTSRKCRLEFQEGLKWRTANLDLGAQFRDNNNYLYLTAARHSKKKEPLIPVSEP